MNKMDDLLKLEHYNYIYAGKETTIINEVCFSLNKGDFVLLTGASGSGKSTLLRQMKKELVPAGMISGKLFLKGKELEQVSHRESAESIGYMGQNIEQQIVSEKVWQEIAFGLENLGWSHDQIKHKVQEMVDFFQLQDLFYRNTNQLSGGQKQRVILASIMAMEPEILLLDEPTSQLDDDMAQELLYELHRMNQTYGTAIVLAEHRIRYAKKYCNRFCIIDEGRLKEITGEEIPSFQFYKKSTSLSKGNQESAIDVCGVTFYYEKDKPILEKLNLTVPKGELFHIVGKNGVGKTTLLQLICGIRKPSQGTIRCNGTVALVPQNPKALFTELTVKDELPSVSLRGQLALIGLEERHPYDLSGGQQQRLAIGKILQVNPDILLLDEPTKGLDYELKEVLGLILETLASKGVTILCVSHDIEFCEQYGTIYRLPISKKENQS